MKRTQHRVKINKGVLVEDKLTANDPDIPFRNTNLVDNSKCCAEYRPVRPYAMRTTAFTLLYETVTRSFSGHTVLRRKIL